MVKNALKTASPDAIRQGNHLLGAECDFYDAFLASRRTGNPSL